MAEFAKPMRNQVLSLMSMPNPLRHVFAISGSFVMLAALLVIYGWHARQEGLISLHLSAYMRYNSAWCFLLLGAALVAAAVRWPRAAQVMAAVVGAFTLMTLLEYICGTNFGIDQLFMHDYLTTKQGLFPGRMSPATAFNFVLMAIAFIQLFGVRQRSTSIAILSMVVVAQACVVLAAYSMGVMAAYKHVFYVGMALHTALLFVILAFTLLFALWRLRMLDSMRLLPVIVVIGMLSFSLVLWQILVAEGDDNLKRILDIETSATKAQIETAIDTRSRALRRMADRWDTNTGTTYPVWLADSQAYLRDIPDLETLQWLNMQGRVVWSIAREPQHNLVGSMVSIPAAAMATSITQSSGDGKHYSISLPLQRKGKVDGYLHAVFDSQQLLSLLLKRQLDSGYQIRVQQGRTTLFSNTASAVDHRLDSQRDIRQGGVAWQLTLSPNTLQYNEMVGSTPLLALWSGVLMSLLLMGLAELYLRSSRQKETLEQRNLEIADSEKKYRSVLNELDYGVAVIQDNCLAYTNPALEKLQGYAPGEMIGLTFPVIVAPEFLTVFTERYTRRISGDQNQPVSTYEMQLLKKGGTERIWVEIHARPSRLDERPAVLAIIRDLTTQKTIEQQATFLRERMELVAGGAVDGIWDWDVVTGEVYFSPRWLALLDYAPDELAQHVNSWIAQLHPDEKDVVLEQIRRHLELHEPYDLEYRLRKKGGEYVWFHARGQAKWDEQGKALRMAGSMVNINQRKQNEAALRQSEQRFRLLVEGVQEYAIYMLDTQGNIVIWNSGAERNKGYSAGEIIGKNFSLFFSPEDVSAGMPQQELEHAKRDGRFETEGWRIRKDGTQFWAGVMLTAIIDENGQHVGFAKVTRDLTQRRQQEIDQKNALQEKEILLKEVYHRVKNNLQVIRSLLNLQSRSLLDEEARVALLETASRVSAMALVHEKLYQSGNLAAIDLQGYIHDLLKQLQASWSSNRNDIQIVQHVTPVQIDLDRAVPLGLLLNELVSNSFKHAFPQNRQGKIEVSVLNVDDSTVIQVADDGIGFPDNIDQEKSKSMGLKLSHSLAGQLDGKLLMVRGEKGGTVFTARLKKFA